MKSSQSLNPNKTIKIITPPDSIDTTELDILAVDLNDEDQKTLLESLLSIDVDVNIWAWNSKLGHDPAWLLNNAEQCNIVLLRESTSNPLASMLISKTNSFYITNGQVNILDKVAVNTVSNIKEVPLHV